MAELPRRPDFLTLWGITRGAVELLELGGNRNRVTQYIHNAYRENYLARDEVPPPLSIQEVNQVVSLAYDQRAAKRELSRARDQLNRTGIDSALTARMRAPDIDAAAGAGYVRPEKLRVRVGFTTSEETLPTQWVTMELDLGSVSQVSEIQDMAEEFAASSAADYGLDYDGLESIEITFT